MRIVGIVVAALVLCAGCSVLGSIESDIKEHFNAGVGKPANDVAGPGRRYNQPLESVSCKKSDALDHVEYFDAYHTCQLTFEDGARLTICAFSKGSRRYAGHVPRGSCEQAAAGGWGAPSARAG